MKTVLKVRVLLAFAAVILARAAIGQTAPSAPASGPQSAPMGAATVVGPAPLAANGTASLAGAGGMPASGAVPAGTLPTMGVPAMPSVSQNNLAASATPISGPPPAIIVQFPPAQVTAYDGTVAPLYGTGLFTGAFAGSTISTRPDYVVQIGDTIDVKTFGNMSLNVVGRVNTDGRFFLPIIGPVTLAGVSRAQLNAVLQMAVGAVYSNTRVYADIVQPGSVGVFVTGNIQRPGRYLGSTTDDVLYFLDKAGGIDGTRGSFRDVLVRHLNGREEHVDLYDFLTAGSVQPMRFADGDVIVVQPRGPQVVVTGMVLNPYAFEIKLPAGLVPSAAAQAGFSGSVPDAGSQVLALAKPNARLSTGAYVRSVHDREPVSSYLPYGEFGRVGLGDGDHVEFRSDAVAATIAVSVTVAQPIPSVYVMPRTATLQDVLAQVPHDSPTADYQAVYLLRRSVAIQQKQMLNAALLRLQEDAYAASALSPSASAAAAANAALVPQFIAAASQVVPSGQIAVYRDGRFDNIRLEDGDQIVIPEKSDVVQVGGEALNPGAFAFRAGTRVHDYIDDAGGFTVAANRHKFVLRKLNGVASVVDRNGIPEAGDQILIVPAVKGQGFQLIKDIATLVFQLALTTATVLRI